MSWLALLAALTGLAGRGSGFPQPTRVLAGTPPRAVVSAEIWLIANRWGAYPAVLVATIEDGRLERRETVQFPKYWNQASSYKVLVAVSDEPVEPPRATYHDFGYGTVGRPGYLKRFPTIYLSPGLAPEELGRNWGQAFDGIGRVDGNTLFLPPPERRTIRLEYPDGKPLADAYVYVSLYGSRQNHCGVAVGVSLGSFTTNLRGEISFVATRSALTVSTGSGYFKEEKGGPAETMLTAESNVIVGTEADVTIKRQWSLPSYVYTIGARSPSGSRMTLARVMACDNFDGCGSGCGPLYLPPREASSGTLRFHAQDLREMRSITLVNAAGQKRPLTQAEMRQLLTTHRLRVVW